MINTLTFTLIVNWSFDCPDHLSLDVIWVTWGSPVQIILISLLLLLILFTKKNLYGPVLWIGSTASRLEPIWGGSLLFTTKSPEIPGTHFIDLGRMKGWVDLGATQWFWTRDPLLYFIILVFFRAILILNFILLTAFR